MAKRPLAWATAVILISGAAASCSSGEGSNRNRNSALPTTTLGEGETSVPSDSTLAPDNSSPTDSIPEGTTSQEALVQTGAASGDEFGGAVTVSADGTTLAVAAMRHKEEQGAVTVFVKDNGKWMEQQVLSDAEGAAKDWFGYSMAISANGSTLAISSVYSDVDGKKDAGSVSVYSRDNGKWTLSKKLTATSVSAGDIFGVSVSLSTDGRTLAVGASGADAGAANSGAVTVFAAENNSWTAQGVLSPKKPVANGNFGASVSLSMNGDTLAVGGPSGGTGQAFVFSRANGTWS